MCVCVCASTPRLCVRLYAAGDVWRSGTGNKFIAVIQRFHVSIGCRFARAMAIGIGSEPATWHLAGFFVSSCGHCGCDDSYVRFDDEAR